MKWHEQGLPRLGEWKASDRQYPAGGHRGIKCRTCARRLAAGADIVSVVIVITLHADPARAFANGSPSPGLSSPEITALEEDHEENGICRAVRRGAQLRLRRRKPADKLEAHSRLVCEPRPWPIIIANKLGYFRQAGWTDIVAPADASVPTKMVAAGQADLAASYQQQVHLQYMRALPVIRVGTLIDSPLNCLMTRDDGSVNAIADLKGKKIGYSVAGVEETLLGTILGQHGVKLSDVELIMSISRWRQRSCRNRWMR